jgi:predicted secreted hydrolase
VSVVWTNQATGASGTAGGTTAWTAPAIALVPGNNVIRVTARDGVGNVGTDTITVTYDATSPVCTITFPASAPSYVASSSVVDLGGTASDNVGVTTVAWSNAATGASGTASGTTSWVVLGVALAVGDNVITVTARDGAGNAGSDTITVTYDAAAPLCMIVSPTAQPTYSSPSPTVSLGGTGSDNVGVTSVTWTNASTGASGLAAGTTSWVVVNVLLAVGENVITVTARDGAGNLGTDSIAVTYDAQAPVCTITSPTASVTYAVTTDRIDLAGSASDNVGVTVVVWTNHATGANGTAVGTGSWNVAGIVLAQGANPIVVAARDADGNAGSDLLTVTYGLPDTTPPVCRITVPATNEVYSTDDEQMTLSGVSSDDIGVVSVSWTNVATGGSGVAIGTTSWAVVGIDLSAGDNEITVRARDAAGNVGRDAIVVTRLSQTNSAPVADAGSDRSVPANREVVLDGSGCSDPDGDALTYLWEQISGPRVVVRHEASAGAAFLPTEPGAYVFRLTVSDGHSSSSDSVIVTVTDEVDTLMVIPNRVAEDLVGTVTVKGPPVLRDKAVAVYTASGAPVRASSHGWSSWRRSGPGARDTSTPSLPRAAGKGRAHQKRGEGYPVGT